MSAITEVIGFNGMEDPGIRFEPRRDHRPGIGPLGIEPGREPVGGRDVMQPLDR